MNEYFGAPGGDAFSVDLMNDFAWTQLERGWFDDVVEIRCVIEDYRNVLLKNPPLLEAALTRLPAMRRLKEVRMVDLVVRLGRPGRSARASERLAEGELAAGRRIVAAITEVLRELPAVDHLSVDIDLMDVAGDLHAGLFRACPRLRSVELYSLAGFLPALRALPLGVTALKANEYGYLEASARPTVAQIAAALGGHPLEALVLDLYQPADGEALAQLLRSPRFLYLALRGFEQADLDLVGRALEGGNAQTLYLQLRGATPVFQYDCAALAWGLATLPLRKAEVWSAEEPVVPWNAQSYLLLSAMLRSPALADAYPGAPLPEAAAVRAGRSYLRTHRGRPNQDVSAIQRATCMLDSCWSNEMLPGEMMLPVASVASGYPEWFVLALRVPLDELPAHLDQLAEGGTPTPWLAPPDEVE